MPDPKTDTNTLPTAPGTRPSQVKTQFAARTRSTHSRATTMSNMAGLRMSLRTDNTMQKSAKTQARNAGKQTPHRTSRRSVYMRVVMMSAVKHRKQVFETQIANQKPQHVREPLKRLKSRIAPF